MVESIQFSDVLTILSILAAVFGSAWRINASVSNKMSEQADEYRAILRELRKEHAASINEVHRRINDVKDTYAKRVDIDRDFTNLYALISGIKDDIRGQMSEMNVRLDRIISPRDRGK